MGFESLIKSAKKIPNQLEKEVLRSLKRHDNRVLDYIIDVQLFEKGEDGQGLRLRSTVTGSDNYSPFTIEQKKIKGQRFDHFTLQDEGDFKSSFKLTVKGLVTADTKKPTQDLAVTFGKDILVLGDKGQDVMIKEFVLEDTQNFTRKNLQQ